jgi:hypothetical protein
VEGPSLNTCHTSITLYNIELSRPLNGVVLILVFILRSYLLEYKKRTPVFHDRKRMPTEDEPVVRDNYMCLWHLVADENAIITSNDLSPSFRLRQPLAERVRAFQNVPESSTQTLLTYQRQVRPTMLTTPPSHSSSHSSNNSGSSTPRRVALQALVDRKDNELNILRQELIREETQHQNVRCELSSYKQLVHDFCVLQVQTHRQATRPARPARPSGSINP